MRVIVYISNLTYFCVVCMCYYCFSFFNVYNKHSNKLSYIGEFLTFNYKYGKLYVADLFVEKS